MRFRLLVRPLALAALPLALLACQDPSGVGLDLIDEEGGVPASAVVAADSAIALTDEPDATGGFGAGGSPQQLRVLVGRAQDALLGDVEAVAYLDVVPPASFPGGFRERPLTSVTLRLQRDYVYGDSAATLALELAELVRGFQPTGAPADTAFEAGALVESYTVSAADSLVELALPAAWVTANATRLRTDSARTAFDGFRLRVADGAQPNAVIGFETVRNTGTSIAARSVLRLTTAQDTVDYTVGEVFSSLTRGPAGMVPSDRLLVRDEAGEALALSFDLAALDTLAVANATLRLDVDPATVEAGTFLRPLPPRLALFGRAVGTSGGRVVLAEAVLNTSRTQYAFTSARLTQAVQRALLGDPLYRRYEVVLPASPVSLDALPVVLGPVGGAPDGRPRFTLTVVADPN